MGGVTQGLYFLALLPIWTNEICNKIVGPQQNYILMNKINILLIGPRLVEYKKKTMHFRIYKNYFRDGILAP